MEIDRDLVRYGLLIAATPVWWPFLRALWKDFNTALREDGGLLGAPPMGRELDEIRRQRREGPENLVSEPIVPADAQRAPRLSVEAARRGPPQATRAPASPRRTGFRSGGPPNPRG